MAYGPVCAKVNNKVEGMNFRLYHNKDIEFLDMTSGSGSRNYTRTLFFILCKAVHDLFPRSYVVIDIPAGSNNKYEYDHDLGCFTLDRVVHHSMFYPFNYGFLPQTLSKDGDPCDVCLYTTNPLFTGCVVKARPIGILYTSDDAGDDPKIIAVPISKVDPRRDEVKTIEDLGAHKKEELEIFFKEIKRLEHKKYDKIQIKGFGDLNDVAEELTTSIKRYQEEDKH